MASARSLVAYRVVPSDLRMTKVPSLSSSRSTMTAPSLLRAMPLARSSSTISSPRATSSLSKYILSSFTPNSWNTFIISSMDQRRVSAHNLSQPDAFDSNLRCTSDTCSFHSGFSSSNLVDSEYILPRNSPVRSAFGTLRSMVSAMSASSSINTLSDHSAAVNAFGLPIFLTTAFDFFASSFFFGGSGCGTSAARERTKNHKHFATCAPTSP